MLTVLQVPTMRDNYVYLAHDPATGHTAIVDPGVEEAVVAALEAQGWTPTHILNTHHHYDHTDANLALKERYGLTVIGAAHDAERIPGIDVRVSDGDTVSVGNASLQVIDVPGHTRGHIAYYARESGLLFCGDTLFALGCGRMFEGTKEDMWASMEKLRALPDDTRVCCAHEYTLANAAFALSIDPDNNALKARIAEFQALRDKGQPTVPSVLGAEKATNPFLRADEAALASQLGMAGKPASDVFGEIRARKDTF